MAWNKRTFKNASKEIGKLKRYLTELLNQQSSEVDWGKVKEEIHKLWIQEEMFWGQQSRLKWIK